jgi:hypothetical protein
MKGKKRRTVVLSLPLTEGNLQLVHEYIVTSPAYDAAVTESRSFFVWNPHSAKPITLESLPDLIPFLRNSELLRELSNDPRLWAECVAYVLEAGRVISPHPLWDWLQRAGFNLEDYRPQIVGGSLHCLTFLPLNVLNPRLRDQSYICHVQLDSATVEPTLSPIVGVTDLETGRAQWRFSFHHAENLAS